MEKQTPMKQLLVIVGFGIINPELDYYSLEIDISVEDLILQRELAKPKTKITLIYFMKRDLKIDHLIIKSGSSLRETISVIIKYSWLLFCLAR